MVYTQVFSGPYKGCLELFFKLGADHSSATENE